MRVTWLTPAYPWAGDPISGSFHRTQAAAVAAAGADVRIVSPRPYAAFPMTRLRPQWAAYAAMPRVQQDGPVAVARPRYLAVPGEPAWAQPSRMIARAAWTVIGREPAPDVLHGHFVVPTGMAARRVARRLNRPYVLTVHGYDATSWPEAHRDSLGEYRATLQGAAAVITVSGALGKRIAELSGVTTTTLPLGVDHASLRALAVDRTTARERLGLPLDRPVVLFAAANREHKGLREFADAMIGLGGEALAVVIGAGPLQGYRADDGTRTAALRYDGPQDRAGVVAYMAAADMLVLPSYQEGLPTVLVEAGSLGLPVIATAVDGTPELLGEDRGVLIEPRDPAAIARAVTDVLADPVAATARANRLRSVVEADYDALVNAAALVRLYANVAGRA